MLQSENPNKHFCIFFLSSTFVLLSIMSRFPVVIVVKLDILKKKNTCLMKVSKSAEIEGSFGKLRCLTYSVSSLFRFNTGSGTGTALSKVQISQGRWHQLVVTRNRRNAMLSVDSEPHIEGESPRGTDGLNLDTNLFIGGVPEDIKQE